MEILTALNQMLIASGEAQVEGLDTGHPLQDALLQILDDVNRSTQSSGWWFNEYDTLLEPDTDGRIPIDERVIRIRPISGRSFVKRGQYLIDQRNRSDIFDKPVQAFVTELWDIEELPQTFAQYVVSLASASAAQAYDGDSLKLQALLTRVEQHRAPVMKEHIDNSRVNMFETYSMTNKLMDTRLNRYGVQS